MAEKCMCESADVLVFPCSGSSDEHAGFMPECFNLKEPGFEKGKTKINDELIEKAVALIIGGKE